MKPTIGRVVHFIPPGGGATSPKAAIITQVWSDTCVNLAIFDGNGNPIQNPPTSILLIQEGNEIPTGGNYCVWPPKV